ncbi:hypothetical protein HK100_010601 [Physocladia obscura]|uniref:Peroxidase n=1 Tax=Physocladia obscura TaxID=109957 RepID=A0AAD5XH31_9FUNG|nr:hypothetical protein HK100_010601 [Physocladia obscura]
MENQHAFSHRDANVGHRHIRRQITSTSTNYTQIKEDIQAALTDSQSFWPADFGDYAPFFIRLAWHCSGSHRRSDGRGGCDGGRIRFLPEHAWADNTNLDKAIRILTPVKQKYPEISWGDFIVFTGNTAIESMGGPTLGFCAGRQDDSDGSASVELGPTPEQVLLANCTLNGNCSIPLGTKQIGLIYVNPGGPLGVPDPVGSAKDIRDVFSTRMGFTDNETVALIGGGHEFGKTHGACPSGPGPSPLEDPTNPWPGTCGTGALKGIGPNAYTSGFEGSWTDTPTQWSNDYFNNLLDFDWETFIGPGNQTQWRPTNASAPNIRMLTADIALLHDPIYKSILPTYANDLQKLGTDFAAAWYKLTTEDMGPQSRCINADAPPPQEFQNPLPAPPANPASASAVSAAIKSSLLYTANSNITSDSSENGGTWFGTQFVDLAYQCASTYRSTDYRGGCNGARIRFSPEKDLPWNAGTDQILQVLESVKTQFGDALTWSDLIVLAAQTALADATSGSSVVFDFAVGRSDALDGTQSISFPFRDYYETVDIAVTDSADVVGLSAYDVVALAGRPRSDVEQKRRGLFGSYLNGTSKLTNAYYNLLLNQTWTPIEGSPSFLALSSSTGVYESKENPGTYMLDSDIFLLSNATYKDIVEEFASNESSFLVHFAEAWNWLLLVDLHEINTGGANTTGGGIYANGSFSEKNFSIVIGFLVALFLVL